MHQGLYSQHRRQREEQENLEWEVVVGSLDICYNRSDFESGKLIISRLAVSNPFQAYKRLYYYY